MESEPEEPNELRERLIKGDRDALAELFAQHRDRLWRIVHFRMDSRMATRLSPDDILQDAFIDASVRLSHYTQEKQFSPFVWLRMIVGQTLIDAHRKHLNAQQRDASREVSAQNGNFQHSTAASLTNFFVDQLTSPSQAAVRSEQYAELRAAIETMEPIDREVLALRHFEELGNKEIAEVLEIEQKAASIRYVRAISRLRKILGEIPNFAQRLDTAS